MGISTGYKQSLKYGRETKYGSAGAINREVGLVQSVTPTETNNLIKVRTLGGTRDFSSIVAGKYEVSGSFEYFLQEARFLKYAIGEDSASTGATDSGPRFIYANLAASTGTTYHHIMGSAASPDSGNFPSFTLEFADDETSATTTLMRKYTGCRVDSLTISGAVDEPVTVSCDWMSQGASVSTASPTAVTSQTEDPFVFYQGAMYMTSGAVTGTSLPTGTVSELNTFSFSVSNNLEPVWYISGTTNTTQTLRGIKDLLAKGREYESTVELNFANRLQYQRFLGANSAYESQGTLNKYQVVIDLVRAGGPGAKSTSADNDWLRIVMASCAFEDSNIPGAPEDIVTETYTIFVESSKLHTFDDLSGSYA